MNFWRIIGLKCVKQDLFPKDSFHFFLHGIIFERVTSSQSEWKCSQGASFPRGTLPHKQVADILSVTRECVVLSLPQPLVPHPRAPGRAAQIQDIRFFDAHPDTPSSMQMLFPCP